MAPTCTSSCSVSSILFLYSSGDQYISQLPENLLTYVIRFRGGAGHKERGGIVPQKRFYVSTSSVRFSLCRTVYTSVVVLDTCDGVTHWTLHISYAMNAVG